MEVLSGVVTMCKSALTLENLNITTKLAEILHIIHGNHATLTQLA